MKINRSNIIAELFHFSQEGNGVIIGKPGIGKSYCIAELSESLIGQKIPVFIIPIDTLPDGTDQSIENALESIGDWISYLDQIKLSVPNRAVLIFDAFDASRDEIMRKQILTQISKAISRLKKWNVIVSVRTYDATKSPQLIKLFGTNNFDEKIVCRYYEISELNETELLSAFESNPGLGHFYEVSDQDLKSILKIPFFLRLLEIVLQNIDVIKFEEIKLVKSETELLNKYWDKKITNTEHSYKKEILLTKIASTFVQNRSMSYLKAEFVEDEETFKELRSDDLVNEVGFGQKYISFSHNILFDYFVGRLIIPTEPIKLINFITEDESRPFFLRPSFIYHFTILWHQHRGLFWENILFINNQTKINILLFKRLLLISVIANEFETISDLNPILQESVIVHQLLQSIRFLFSRKIGNRDFELLYYLSTKLEPRFLWDYSILFEKILQNENFNQPHQIEIQGIISRRFLNYILVQRKLILEGRQFFDRLGSLKGIQFVSITFSSNIQESIQLFREVLDVLNEPDFEIWYFSRLIDNIDFYIKDAPELVSEIYQRILFHTENSNDKTHMGSVTLNFISNRRQDFNLCHAKLLELYPSFLTASPEIAIKTGLIIVNEYVKNNNLHSELVTELSYYEIRIKDIHSQFLPDFSSMWSGRHDFDKPVQMIEIILNYFDQLITESRLKELFNFIDLYIAYAKLGFIWKKLLIFLNKHSYLLKDYLFQLALNEIILKSGDTIYEIGISINKIFTQLNKNDRRKLETTILKLLKIDDRNSIKYITNTVNRLLNCIPKGSLQLKKSKEIIKRFPKAKNEPTFQSSWSSKPYTSEVWLEEQGVDLKVKRNKEIYDRLTLIEEFNSKMLNSIPNREEFADLLKIASNLFEQITMLYTYDSELEFYSLKEITQFYSIILRDSSQINKEDYLNAKKVIQFSIKYNSKFDESVDKSKSPSSGYSPTPRIEASGALINLFSIGGEDDILEEIKLCSVDSNPVVRFNVLKDIAKLWHNKPFEYWEILFERLANEPDSFTISTILSNLYRKDISEVEEMIVHSIELAATRISEFGTRDSFIKEFTGLLLYLFDNKKNIVSKKIIYDNLDNIDFTQSLVFKLFDFIDPKFVNNDYTLENTRKELIQLFQDIVSKYLDFLKNDDPNKFLEEKSDEKDRLFLIDSVVQRIYYGLDIKDRSNNKFKLRPNERNKQAFYDRVKPIILNIVNNSKDIGGGVMVAHTAHYLIETLCGVIKFYPQEANSILKMTAQITELSYKTGYTFDPSAIEEVVRLTEILFADHKELLREPNSLNNLVTILNIYVETGWPQAMELLWKLDQVFK